MEVDSVASIAAEYYLNNTTYQNAVELCKVDAEIAAAQEVDTELLQTYLEHKAAIKFVIRLSIKKELASGITLV